MISYDFLNFFINFYYKPSRNQPDSFACGGPSGGLGVSGGSFRGSLYSSFSSGFATTFSTCKSVQKPRKTSPESPKPLPESTRGLPTSVLVLTSRSKEQPGLV